jgi:small multidrug resistance pump
MHAYVTLALAIAAEVIATSALKASDGFSKAGPSALVVLGYVVAFFSLSHTIKTMSLGIVYAIWSGVGIVLITAAGWWLYNQKLDAPAMVGMGLIVAGVLVINLLSTSVTQ